MKAFTLVLAAAGIAVLSACAAAPLHSSASNAAPDPNPAVVSVSGEDIKLTGHTNAATALRELVPSVH